MSWSRNHAALLTKCYSLPNPEIKHSCYMTPKMCCLLYSFPYLVQCCCHYYFFKGTELDLLIAIMIMISWSWYCIISLSWYHNHYKYLPIYKMITVINTSDKSKNNEMFQNHQLQPHASLSFSHSPCTNHQITIISFSQVSLSVLNMPPCPSIPMFRSDKIWTFHTFTCNAFN